MIRLCGGPSLRDEVWMILARWVDFVSVKWIDPDFAEEPAAVILCGRQDEDFFDRQIPGHLDAEIERIGVMIGVAMTGKAHVEVALVGTKSISLVSHPRPR